MHVILSYKLSLRFWHGLALCLLSGLCFCALAARARQNNYVLQHQALAAALEAEYQIPKQLILGVAIVETGSGQTNLCKKQNNHFGIRSLLRKNKRSKYHNYTCAEESFRHFCDIISRKKLYQSLKGNSDYRLWIAAIAKTGYSAQPAEWTRRVLQAIADNNL